MNQAMTKLQVKYEFKSLFVVAHNVGGLVARDFIHKNTAGHDPELIKLFVTLSTPWEGHAAAGIGLRIAPAIIPSWYDIVPDSPYLHAVLDQPLPANTPHYLMFSHGGSPSVIGEGNSDGMVTLQSQLPDILQARAAEVIGYDQDHAGILLSEQVMLRLNRIMAEVGDGPELVAGRPYSTQYGLDPI